MDYENRPQTEKALAKDIIFVLCWYSLNYRVGKKNTLRIMMIMSKLSLIYEGRIL